MNNIKRCDVCNEVGKFNMRKNKDGVMVIARKKCIKCISSKNNLNLKNKQYYKNYYIRNAETLKQKDRERYLRTKSLNSVSFNITPND